MKTIYIPQLKIAVNTQVTLNVYNIIVTESNTMYDRCAIDSALLYGTIHTDNDTNVYILSVEEYAEFLRFTIANSKAIAKEMRDKYKLT